MTVRDIFLEFGPSYLETFAENIPSHHLKVIQAIVTCRTPQLGTIVCQREGCGKTYEIFRSRGNRHCPLAFQGVRNCSHQRFAYSALFQGKR